MMKHKDKLMHFAVCLLTTFISPYLAIGLAIGKEYGDYKASGNHWCWWDILADILGVLLGIVIMILLM